MVRDASSGSSTSVRTHDSITVVAVRASVTSRSTAGSRALGNRHRDARRRGARGSRARARIQRRRSASDATSVAIPRSPSAAPTAPTSATSPSRRTPGRQRRRGVARGTDHQQRDPHAQCDLDRRERAHPSLSGRPQSDPSPRVPKLVKGATPGGHKVHHAAADRPRALRARRRARPALYDGARRRAGQSRRSLAGSLGWPIDNRRRRHARAAGGAGDRPFDRRRRGRDGRAALSSGACASAGSSATESSTDWAVTHTELRLRAAADFQHVAGRGAFGIRLGVGPTIVHETRDRNQAMRAGLTGSAAQTTAFSTLPSIDLDAVIGVHIAGPWLLMMSGGRTRPGSAATSRPAGARSSARGGSRERGVCPRIARSRRSARRSSSRWRIGLREPAGAGRPLDAAGDVQLRGERRLASVRPPGIDSERALQVALVWGEQWLTEPFCLPTQHRDPADDGGHRRLPRSFRIRSHARRRRRPGHDRRSHDDLAAGSAVVGSDGGRHHLARRLRQPGGLRRSRRRRHAGSGAPAPVAERGARAAADGHARFAATSSTARAS